MVTDFFGVFLQELGSTLEIKDLRPDSNNSCLISLKNGVQIQLELDRSRQFLVIGSDLGAVPPGRYRENLFREALKTNGMPYPLYGILSYSKKTDHLILFHKSPIGEINGEKIASFITLFAEKALVWKNAVSSNEIPVMAQTDTSRKSSGGMFGLMP
jgi:Tir chaperone protein (CesT) family